MQELKGRVHLKQQASPLQFLWNDPSVLAAAHKVVPFIRSNGCFFCSAWQMGWGVGKDTDCF